MREIAIIADDLTGASDSGVQFARKNLQTRVIFDLEHFADSTRGIHAAVIDTDSRSLPADEAYRKVKQASAVVNWAGFQHIYKKMDSTLRGNPGAEIDAVMDEIRFDFAVCAPAYPKTGRTTYHGIHALNGQPVNLTEIAFDPVTPVKEADLVKLLSTQSKQKPGLVSLETLHAGREAVFARIHDLLQEGCRILVFDALSEADMRQIAETMAASRYRILWVGSAGLADYLPGALSLRMRESGPFALSFSGEPVLLVAGSVSQLTRSQVAAFNTDLQIRTVELDAVKLVTSEEAGIQEKERCRSELLRALSGGTDASLSVSSSPEQVKTVKEKAALRGFDGIEVSRQIADALGFIVAGVLEEVALQGLILTGGDTAKAVCKHLGASGLHLIREIEPGIPLGRLLGKNPLWVVTKAGGFGQEQSLIRALKVLKGERSNE